MLKPISKERTDNLDGSYVIKEIYNVNYLVDYLSCIKNYDKDNVWIGGISYKDKNFEEILYNYKIKFKEDGSYIKEAIYLTPNKDGIMSFVEEYNKNDKLLNGSYYKAADFKHLILTCTYKYKSNGCYTKFITYFEPNKYGQVSVVEDYDKHDRLLGEKSYENNNFKNLDNLSKHEDEYKNKYKHSAYKDSQNRQFTNKKTSKSSKFGRIIFVILMGITVFATKVLIHVGAKHTSKTTLYKFVDIILNRTYREDGSYTKTVVRVKPTKDGTMSFVEEYDKDDKLLSGKYYKDREFKEFNYMINYTYRKNGGHTKTVIRTTPDKYGSMSFVEEYDKDDKLLSGKYYKDKEFKELDYTSKY